MRKSTIITAAVFVLAAITVLVLYYAFKSAPDDRDTGKVYHAGSGSSEPSGTWKNVSAEEMGKFFAPAPDFKNGEPGKAFAVSVVNADTLHFFRFLDKMFEDAADIEECLGRADPYLSSVLPPFQARQMLEMYKTYLDYQLQMQENMKHWYITGSTAEALDNLARIREFRRSFFGVENADVIFGASEKADEYTIRRRMILDDQGMFGYEKERRMRALNEAMWGSQTMPYDENLTSYARYQEKLSLYSKDLADALTTAETEAILDEIRRQTFTPEELHRMDEARDTQAREAAVKEDYHARRQEIIYSNLDPAAENLMLHDLQNAMFGEQAHVIRREEAIQKGFAEIREKAAAEAGSHHRSPEEALEELNKKISEMQREANQAGTD